MSMGKIGVMNPILSTCLAGEVWVAQQEGLILSGEDLETN